MKVRIVQINKDSSFNRGQMELDALPPIGATILMQQGSEFEKLVLREVQLVVGTNLNNHYALLVNGEEEPYTAPQGVVSPPWHPDQANFTIHGA